MKAIENKASDTKKPWPTKKAMQQVYEMKLWGSNQTAFYSGEGSHDPHIIKPYIEAVCKFLSSFTSALTVCDLGCGDFNVGKEFVTLSRKLIAVDIVPELIAHNQNTFQIKNLEFKCLDIAKDPLPKGDCVLVRQVLQHISNAEIKAILGKLKQYKYVILTEHLPKGDFEPNIDIISGQGTRLKKGSGVDVLKEPFCLEVQSSKILLEVPLEVRKGTIVSTLYTIF